MPQSTKPRGSFGLDEMLDCWLIKIPYEFGHLTVENYEAKDDSKSSKSLEAPQGAQIVSSCCQRMVRSFIKTI